MKRMSNMTIKDRLAKSTPTPKYFDITSLNAKSLSDFAFDFSLPITLAPSSRNTALCRTDPIAVLRLKKNLYRA